MTSTICASTLSSKYWAFKTEQSSEKLSIDNFQFSEEGLKKLKELSPKSLTFGNTHFTKPLTERLLEIIGDLRVNELRFINCTMRDEHAEIFAFSKEKVVFNKCLLTHLYEKNSFEKERIDLGFLNIGEEVAIFNPDLIELGEESSEIFEDLRKKIDAPDRTLKIEKRDNNHSRLAEQVQRAMMLIHTAREFCNESRKHIEILDIDVNPDAITLLVKNGVDNLETILRELNKSAYENAKHGIRFSKKQIISQLDQIHKAYKGLENEIQISRQIMFNFLSANVY